ncbi:hypothetical protein TraAM80_03509 [Trypanosoma rangeli]|uniref:Uncharacterized protein n=1 Tax=Trypanosoma rangeli TaxID=5698 RepID=A0A422NP57_TRYRA|nr:uncharacterized protein TraAM80_03509 [Trypanosoma rangeli]RNF07216.1 hypothetical protein TraAM80_03509 [Trypanosoma rangeli]|eukprot:RNF07216.1 hypothetical protein TraAM80_03509 [Trypanosoma rangeli]
MCTNAAADLREVLLQAAESRVLAFGGLYTDVPLTEDALRGAERDVHRARIWEQQRVQSALRRAELNAQRQRLLEAERRGESSAVEAVGAIARELRAKAMSALQLHAETVAAQAPQTYLPFLREADGAPRALGVSATSATASVPRAVINVDMGGGRVDRLVLRDGDDVDEAAAAFVRRHGLPHHAVDLLAAQALEALGERGC